MDTITFTIACKKFFALKEHQTLAEFAAEIKQLTPADRQEMTPLLARELKCDISN